jgi:pilus assembly protein FimV
MRRRRAAMNLTQTDDHTPEAQAAQVAHEQVTDESAPTPPVADTSAETSIGSAHDGFGDPVDTQIDLLTAYVGMADGQSARQIYDEIQRVGNDAQKAQAKALLARLDA